jgi:predicted aspartyl protease
MPFFKLTLTWLIVFFLCNACWASDPSGWARVNLSIPHSTNYAINSVIIPFQKLGGLIVLRASIDGVEGNFILDTGANGLVLNNQYFKADRLLTDRRGIGLAGEATELGVVRLDSVQFDAIQFKNILAQTIDLRQLENRKNTRLLGLIGYDLLKDFEIMLDYREDILTFSRVDQQGNIITVLPHTSNKVDTVAFTMGNHIPIVKVQIEGKTKRMGIDTGAEYNLYNIQRSRPIMQNFKILKTIEITNTGAHAVQALAGKLFRIVLGDRYRCAGMSTVLINFDHLDEIYGTTLDGILGYEFLAPWLFSINYKKRELYLHKIEFKTP